MDPATLAACSTCDSRSDFVFNMVAAEALREYMTKNRVRMAIERGDVKIGFSLPNERIDTGHSCSVTAEARNINVKAEMLNDKDFLDKNLGEPEYVEDLVSTFIDGQVKHKVDVTADIRHRLGVKLFGSCKRYGRKTCGISATSTGTNYISVTLNAYDIIPFRKNGKQHLRFKLNVDLHEFVQDRTYSPTAVSVGSCKLPFNLFNLKSKVQRYATNYMNKKKYKPVISSGLMKKLETVLKAPMKEEIIIPVNVVGGGRMKRATIVDGCKKKTCPKGFSRIGNTENCKRHFGFSKPNCSRYASNATVKSRTCCGGRRSIYWCEAPMI